MNFFKSVFSDDPDPPQPDSGSGSHNPDPDPSSPELSPSAAAAAWNIGGLLKTLTSKSESIIETYRRDLQEFSTGLKKEIEVAQGSLDEIGTTVVKSTAQIISKSKDAILAVDLESDSDHSINTTNSSRLSSGSNKDRYYNRFDAAIRAIQGDASTYTEEPEDLEEFGNWKLGFSIDDEKRSEEMERLLRENGAMESVYKSFVPESVDGETFWFRYYYKVYRLKKAEDARAKLVGRISTEEEDLSWDVDEDDDGDDEEMGKRELRVGGSGNGNDGESTKKLDDVEELQSSGEDGLKLERRDSFWESKGFGNKTDKLVEESRVEKSEGVDVDNAASKNDSAAEMSEEAISERKADNAARTNDSAAESDEKVVTERKADNAAHTNDSAAESDETVVTERKADNAAHTNDSAAESDEKVVTERKADDTKSSSRNDESSEEEELGWDEIEDLSVVDEKRVTQSGSSTSKVDLRKRLSAAEEEEDLSWEIEDDDEAAKA